MKAKKWNGKQVWGRCDNCGAATKVGRAHYLSATAFHAPVWCVDCVVRQPSSQEKSDRTGR